MLEVGQDAFLFPLMITSNGIVIDGYARLEVARLQGRATVECVEYDISKKKRSAASALSPTISWIFTL